MAGQTVETTRVLRTDPFIEELYERTDDKKSWVNAVPSDHIWEGELPAEALTFDGPVGLRTDNGRFDVELLSTP